MATTLLSRHRRGAPKTPDGRHKRPELIDQVVTRRDHAAFGSWSDGMDPVFGVCRRVLRDPHDAEEAFRSRSGPGTESGTPAAGTAHNWL